jgi:hypothetical protein
MQIRVEEVAPVVTKTYPYTHRVEINGSTEYQQVLDWIDENKIRACALVQSRSIYLNDKDTNWLLLRWS